MKHITCSVEHLIPGLTKFPLLHRVDKVTLTLVNAWVDILSPCMFRSLMKRSPCFHVEELLCEIACIHLFAFREETQVYYMVGLNIVYVVRLPFVEVAHCFHDAAMSVRCVCHLVSF